MKHANDPPPSTQTLAWHHVAEARERRWRPFDQTQDRLFSIFPQ